MNTSAKKNGKWALVTGASAGIGAEFCRQLAGLGYSIVLTARREEPMQALLDELRESHGVDGRVLPADLSRPDAVNGIVTALSEAGIPVEFLVNNAGYGVSGEFNEPDWRAHKDFLTVMLDSVCELTWRLLPGMQARGRGYIVNVASLAGLVPGAARNTLYGATKAFLVRFSESLAMENEDTGVSVSALCPGFTYSEFHDVLGIRDQVSQMPGWMWMDAPEVVRYGIDSVMRDPPRIVAVPGRANRFIAMLSRKLPMRTTQAMTQRQSRRWRKQD
jgi:short-subunit dehydrogenase